MDFNMIYPADIENYRHVTSKQHLQSLLKSSSAIQNITDLFFRINVQANRYMYVRCRYCFSKLKYKKRQQVFELVYSNLKHSHKLKSQHYVISNFLKTLPSNMELKSKRDIVMKSYGINAQQFYYINRKCQPKRKFSDLIESLNSLGYKTRFSPYPLQDQQLPHSIVTIAPYMINNYVNSSKVISYDVTYNMVKQRFRIIQNGQSKEIKYGIGVFLARNQFNKPIPIGLSLINNQSTQSLCDLFYSFFTLLPEPPSVILSDEQRSLIACLQELKQDGIWSGVHMNDQFHIVYNLQKKSKNKKFVQNLKKAMYAETQKEFQQNLLNGYNSIESQSQTKIYRQFQRKASKITFVKSPVQFVGLNISTNYHEKFHDFLKDEIKYELCASQAFEKILQQMHKLHQRARSINLCKTRYEEIFSDQQLKILRINYSKQIFLKFLLNYTKGLEIGISSQQEMVWLFQDGEKIKLQKSIFVCSCFMNVKQGIPCKHQLKLLRMYNDSYDNYFSQHWKTKIIQPVGPLTKFIVHKGRPRLSRRRRF